LGRGRDCRGRGRKEPVSRRIFQLGAAKSTRKIRAKKGRKGGRRGKRREDSEKRAVTQRIASSCALEKKKKGGRKREEPKNYYKGDLSRVQKKKRWPQNPRALGEGARTIKKPKI